jgi:hypothetical protein
MDIFDSHFHQFRDMPLAAMIFSSAILEPAPANSTDKLGAYLIVAAQPGSASRGYGPRLNSPEGRCLLGKPSHPSAAARCGHCLHGMGESAQNPDAPQTSPLTSGCIAFEGCEKFRQQMSAGDGKALFAEIECSNLACLVVDLAQPVPVPADQV